MMVRRGNTGMMVHSQIVLADRIFRVFPTCTHILAGVET
jgi:hypothetical protein